MGDGYVIEEEYQYSNSGIQPEAHGPPIEEYSETNGDYTKEEKGNALYL